MEVTMEILIDVAKSIEKGIKSSVKRDINIGRFDSHFKTTTRFSDEFKEEFDECGICGEEQMKYNYEYRIDGSFETAINIIKNFEESLSSNKFMIGSYEAEMREAFRKLYFRIDVKSFVYTDTFDIKVAIVKAMQNIVETKRTHISQAIHNKNGIQSIVSID
jgi:hypothetical protein